jgi:hypothetical protein
MQTITAEFSPYHFPRFTVLVDTTAGFRAVAWFDSSLYAIDFGQRGSFADWQIWENLADRARFIDRKAEYQSRLGSAA